MKVFELGKDWTSMPLKNVADRIISGAATILQGWDANDLTTHDSADWEAIPWKRFHATKYHYVVHEAVGGQQLIVLVPAADDESKVYVSDKFGPFIQSMREAMWSLAEKTGRTQQGAVYIALHGPACRRHRYIIPLYAPGVSQD